MNTSEFSRLPTSRKTFLKGALSILAAGVGVTTIAAPAHAFVTQCCRNGAGPDGANCPACAGPNVKYFCQNGCNGTTFCTCHANVGPCYNQPC